MAGELWRGSVQAAVEVTYGTAVTTATRRLYYDTPHFTRIRQPRPHKFATGSRDNVRAFTLGPIEVGGELKQPLSADEIVELLLLGVNGGVTPSQPDSGGNPTVYLWTFTPGTSLDSASIQWQDGAYAYQTAGVQVDTLKIAGSANGPAEVTATAFGKSLESGSMTGSLAQRVPSFLEGWETKIFVDAFGGTAGSTQVTGMLVNWDVTLNNQLARKYFAANSNTLGAIALGEIMLESTLTFEASNEEAQDAFEDWDAVTKKLVRLEFGNNLVISNTYKTYVKVDLPGAWSALDLGQTDNGTRVYQLKLQYVYDVTNTFGLKILVQNTRSAAW